MARRKWTAAELERLKVVWTTAETCADVMKEFPNWSWSSISHRASQLQLQRSNAWRKLPRKWKPDLIEKFRHLWETERDRSVIESAFPDKTWAALCCFAHERQFKRLGRLSELPEVLPCSLSDTERAWLAGFIDGEGTIGIHPNYKQKQFITYYTRLGATNTNLDVLKYIQQMVGSGAIIENISRLAQHKRAYTWFLSSREKIRSVLLALLPYLRVRHKQAELVLAFIELRLLAPTKSVAFKLEEQQNLFEQVRQLNARGIQPPHPSGPEQEDYKQQDP